MVAGTDVDQYRSPRKKLLRFFVGSRNDWKAKCAQAKLECKLLGNQVRAVEKSREQWRAQAEQQAQRITELEQEVIELKSTTV